MWASGLFRSVSLVSRQLIMPTANSDLRAFTLADGGFFPTIGLGTWKIPNELTAGVIQDAIRVGYRHFDCACDYGNEPEVGAGLAAAMKKEMCRRDSSSLYFKILTLP